MKWSDNLIIKNIPAHRTNYNKGRYIIAHYNKINKDLCEKERIPLHIVLHYTGARGQTAENNGVYFSRPNRKSSAHYFVGQDGIVQSVDLTNTAWHCGKSYGEGKISNDNTIGIEMCCEIDSKDEWYIPPNVLQYTYDLIKALKHSDKYNIIDVHRHYDITGKKCPMPLLDAGRWHRVKQHIYSL